MTRVEIALRDIAGTGAALGWAGSRTLVVDGAGGRGPGFNGAELLALAIGGRLADDLRCVADDLGARIEAIARATAESTVANSIARGPPVAFVSV